MALCAPQTPPIFSAARFARRKTTQTLGLRHTKQTLGFWRATRAATPCNTLGVPAQVRYSDSQFWHHRGQPENSDLVLLSLRIKKQNRGFPKGEGGSRRIRKPFIFIWENNISPRGTQKRFPRSHAGPSMLNVPLHVSDIQGTPPFYFLRKWRFWTDRAGNFQKRSDRH